MKRYYVWTDEYKYQEIIDSELGGPWFWTALGGIYDTTSQREAKRMFVRDNRREIEREELWTCIHVKEVDSNDPQYMTEDEFDTYCEAHPDYIDRMNDETEHRQRQQEADE